MSEKVVIKGDEMVGPQHESANGWLEWRNYVLKTLEDQTKIMDAMKSEMVAVKLELITLKVKSGFWGVIGGMISAVIATLISFLTIFKKG